MFYFFLAALFIAIYWLVKTDKPDKPLQLAFGMFIFVFLSIEVFTFFESQSLLYGDMIIHRQPLSANQSSSLVVQNGTLNGSLGYIQLQDGLKSNITAGTGVLSYYVNLTGIEDFDYVTVVASYPGNISVRFIDVNGSETQAGVLFYPTQSQNFYKPTTGEFVNNNKVQLHFIDNTFSGTPNISIDYIGVNNRRNSTAYDAYDDSTEWVIAQHRLDYSALEFISMLIAPGGLFFITMIIFNYLQQWYEKKQKGY